MAADAATSGGVAPTSVGNSALFNSANSESLSRTPSSAGNRKTWTFSHWIYKASVSGAYEYFSAGDNNTNHTSCRDVGNGQLNYRHQDGGAVNDNLIPSRLLRDNAWYHVVWAVDTTQSVEFDRVKIYINNELQTIYATSNYPAQDADTDMNSTEPTFVGARTSGPDSFYPGYMAETVLIDGLQLSPSSFGEYDTTGLYWTPKSSTVIKELTFGTNGFYLDNTTNAETDASGEGNNLTNNNTVVTSTHTPSHLDSLYNQLDRSYAALSNGNRTSTGNGYWGNRRLVLPMGTGKWYTEFTCAGAGYIMIGVGNNQVVSYTNASAGQQTGGYQYFSTGGTMYKNNTSSSYGTAWASGTNVIGVAFNGDIGALWFSLNGTWQASATISEVAAGTTTNAAATSLTGGEYSLWTAVLQSGGTVISKEEADFSYTIPTGFTSVTSTNLAATTSRTASDTNKYFQTTLYEGNGAGQRVGAFQPFDNTFTVGNSALFNSTNYLARTPDSTSNTKTATFSKWFKPSDVASDDSLFACWKSTSPLSFFGFYIQAAGPLFVFNYTSGSYDWYLETTRKFKDVTEWTHFMFQVDTTQSTSSDRAKIFVNGVQETVLTNATYPSLNFANYFNTDTVPNYIGPRNGSGGSMGPEGYGAETALVDGTAYAPSYFGETDTSTNRWVPKALTGITWGTHGFYQDYADSDNLGDDESGNGNDFTNNGTVTQTTDSPTTNLAVLDSNFTNATLSNGNRTSDAGSGNCTTRVTIPMTTGKFYWEGGADAQDSTNATPRMGIGNLEQAKNVDMGNAAQTTWAYNMSTNATYYGKTIFGAIQTGSAVSFSTSAVAQFAYDADAGKFWVGKDNTWLFSGDPATGANPTYEGIVGPIFPCVQDTGTSKSTIAIAEADWTYSAPTDFVALAQDNLAGTDQFISAFSWIKNRDATDNHMLFDRVRGATKDLHSNTSDVEVTNVNTVQSFLEAGVQIGNDVQVNTANESYVLWNWMIENTGSGASNEDGSINTTSTLVDTTLGLSISTYTGTGANATFGHGLGVAPKFIIIKGLTNGELWQGFASGLGPTKTTHLNNVSVSGANSVYFNNTAPTSTLVSLGSTGGLNGSTIPYVAYCFAPSQFISIGSYEGNGNANGAFIPTINSLGVPIQPVWAITKSIDSTSNWDMYDKERLGYNPENAHLDANLTTVESTADNLDIVTGGLKMRIASDPNVAETYVYMAIGTPIIDVDGRIIAGR